MKRSYTLYHKDERGKIRRVHSFTLIKHAPEDFMPQLALILVDIDVEPEAILMSEGNLVARLVVMELCRMGVRMSLVSYTPNQQALLISYAGNNKDIESRLRQYVDWLDGNGLNWWSPNLMAYRNHLLERGLRPRSVAANLSAVRSQYKRLIRDRDLFFSMVQSHADDFVHAQALTNEIVQRIENAIHPDEAPVKVIHIQNLFGLRCAV